MVRTWGESKHVFNTCETCWMLTRSGPAGAHALRATSSDFRDSSRNLRASPVLDATCNGTDEPCLHVCVCACGYLSCQELHCIAVEQALRFAESLGHYLDQIGVGIRFEGEQRRLATGRLQTRKKAIRHLQCVGNACSSTWSDTARPGSGARGLPMRIREDEGRAAHSKSS